MFKITLMLCACFCSCVWMKSVAQAPLVFDDAKEKVILIACGSFNPITLMHLRMFEVARDHLQDVEGIEVVGGIVSPAHDNYKKSNCILLSNENRRNMCELALESSNWIRLSEWEMQQAGWTQTHLVLRYYQEQLNSVLNGEVEMDSIPNWLPSNIADYKGQRIQLKLLCGTDFLEAMSAVSADTSNSTGWSSREIDDILTKYSLAVVTRDDSNPRSIVFKSDLLYKHTKKITIIENWITDLLSSSAVRQLLTRGLSVKYLMTDNVIDYIYENGLYDTKVATK